jgi:hypothetical protein
MRSWFVLILLAVIIVTAAATRAYTANGGVTTEPFAVSLTSDNQLVTVGNHSFIQLTSNSMTATDRTFCLTAGTSGQILTLENADFHRMELQHNAIACAGATNVYIGSSWYPTITDTLKLIYDGNAWVEVARANLNDGNNAIDLTAQGADIGATAFLVTAPPAVFMRASCFIVVTTAATTSSTLPACNVTYTDETNTAHTVAMTSTSAANTVGTTAAGATTFYVKSASAIQYSTTGYATSGGTSMNFSVHLRLEQIF